MVLSPPTIGDDRMSADVANCHWIAPVSGLSATSLLSSEPTYTVSSKPIAAELRTSPSRSRDQSAVPLLVRRAYTRSSSDPMYSLLESFDSAGLACTAPSVVKV